MAKEKFHGECQQLQSISSMCPNRCAEKASGATSERSNKECFDSLVMSVLGARKEGGSMHAIYLSFPGRECYSFGKDQIK